MLIGAQLHGTWYKLEGLTVKCNREKMEQPISRPDVEVGWAHFCVRGKGSVRDHDAFCPAGAAAGENGAGSSFCRGRAEDWRQCMIELTMMIRWKLGKVQHMVESSSWRGERLGRGVDSNLAVNSIEHISDSIR